MGFSYPLPNATAPFSLCPPFSPPSFFGLPFPIFTMLVILAAFAILAYAWVSSESVRDGQIIQVRGITYRVKLVRLQHTWEAVPEG